MQNRVKNFKWDVIESFDILLLSNQVFSFI